MIIHAIELTYVSLFRETVRIGPFAPGLNILAANNESGKSTVVKAATRALFDRHTTKSEEIKALQSAGTDLAPRITVEFETQTGRYRIEKIFLQSPQSLLKVWQSGSWQPIAEADLADQRVQNLLHSSIPGRGATKPEHWGFLGFLWARQGEPVEWPKLDYESVGQRIRHRLARVALDPTIEQLSERLATLSSEIITSTGQPKTGGPLRQAENDLVAIETELNQLLQTRTDLDEKQQRYHAATAEVERLEKELSERDQQAKVLSAIAQAVERLRGELDARLAEFNSAQDKLQAIAADSAAFAKRQTDLCIAKETLAKSDSDRKELEKDLVSLRQQIDTLQSKRPELETRFNQLRSSHQRIQDLLKLRQITVQADALEKQIKKAEKASAILIKLVEKKTKLPVITAAKVQKLENLADAVNEIKAQVQALGLSIELTPERETKIVANDGSQQYHETLAKDTARVIHSPQSLDIQLSGWGRVVVRSGAKEAQQLTRDLAEAETMFREALIKAEVPNIPAARDAVANRKDMDTQIKAAESALADQLGDHESIEGLREAGSVVTRKINAFRGTLRPTENEQAFSLIHLETDDEKLSISIPASENLLKALDNNLFRLRTEERAAVDEVQKATQQANELSTQQRTLETQITDLTARYPDGLGVAKTKAQQIFVEAEARITATRGKLPPDYDKLPERNRRTVAALQQLTNELQVKRGERDQIKGSLETLGAKGLYSRETELLEKREEAVKRREAARAKGWATRIAHDLIEYRKQAATKAVLAPLEQRLTAAFANLTGDAQRKVFLDENLQVSGIGHNREDAYGFDLLSQGAKEQLLLCLRMAVAQELATSEPQILILDDVLVNTDPVRQERVLDVLSTLATQLQIIVLTCHPDRYRGIGSPIQLSHPTDQ